MERAKERAFRLFNPRVLPIFAACLILGIFCVKLKTGVAASILGAAVLFILVLLGTKSLRVGFAIVLCLALLGGYGLAKGTLYYRNSVGLKGNALVECRVIDVTESVTEEETDFGTEEVVTYTVTADSLRAGGKRYFGKITFETTTPIAIGDRLSVKGKVSIRNLYLTSAMGALEYRKGAKYQIKSNATITAKKEGTPPLRDRIREKVRSALIAAEGDRAGGFSYAMLFGDAEFMESTDKTAMREVGVAHVFAVSGLHVGVLAAAILFLLKKLRLKSGIQLLVMLPIFGFYAYLAEFTPSVLRASIMVTVSLAATALGERYDDISALSLAAILILLVRPLYLFDLSFLMSFLAIFGIQSLERPLERTFRRHRVPPRLASGLALSLSTTVALIPVSALVFGRVALVGFLLNIVIVPLASVAFVLTVITLLPTLVIPSFAATLSLVGYLPAIIAEISGAVASLGLKTNYEFSVPEVVVYYVTLIFVGKYCLAKRTAKLVAGGIGGTALIVLLLAV